MDIIVVVICLIIAFIWNSRQKKKADEELQKISNFVSNLDLEASFKHKIISIFGAEFYIFMDVANCIMQKSIPSQYEEVLINTEIIGQKDDIRLFDDNRTEKAIEKWLMVNYTQLMNKQNLTEEKTVEILKSWQKCHTLINMIKTNCMEQFNNNAQSVIEDFTQEKEHTPESYSFVLEKLKKAEEIMINSFEKEILEVKEKFLS